MKYNLAEVTVLDSYSETIGDIEYETITSGIKELEDNLVFVTLLQTIKENSALFKKIISIEIISLQDFIEAKDEDIVPEQAMERCIFLSRLKNIFDDLTKIEHIIVYNSLTESTPETKAVEYFNEEMILLKNIIKNEIRNFMNNYQTTTRHDENFEKIKNISYPLSSLIIKLNKLSKDSMKKSASFFLSQKSLEDQFLFFQNFFQEHIPQGFNKTLSLIPHQNNFIKEEEFIDAELNNDEDNNREESDSNLVAKQGVLEVKDLVTEVLSSVDNIFDEIKSIKEEKSSIANKIESKNDFYETITEKINISQEKHQKQLLALDAKINNVDNKVEDVFSSLKKLSKNFNSFIENQTNFTKLIKERYNLDI